MSTIHIDQFKYTCDRCGKSSKVEVVDVVVVLPTDWIELEGPWDKRKHLCAKCAVDHRDFMKNYTAYAGRSKLHAFDEALKAITHVTADTRTPTEVRTAFSTCQKIAAKALLENP